MKKRDWSDCKLTIGCSGDEDSIIIPIHGEKETYINKIMKNAYYNAIRLLEDSQNVSIESSVVLKTLACELFMKAIIIQKKGVQQRGHDLYDLYYELPEEQQQEVLDSYLLWTIPIGTEITEDIVGVKCDSFFDMLSVNARLFEVVRYKHEYSTIVFHDGYIHFLAKALKGVCEELNIDRE